MTTPAALPGTLSVPQTATLTAIGAARLRRLPSITIGTTTVEPITAGSRRLWPTAPILAGLGLTEDAAAHRLGMDTDSAMGGAA